MNTITKAAGFSLIIIKSNMRDVRSLAISFGLPLFMLFSFWITTRDNSVESHELFFHMVPAVCAMTVMMSAQTLASNLASWREKGALRRLGVTPVPVAACITGISLSHLIIAVLQGFFIFLVCIPATAIKPGLEDILLLFLYMVLTAAAFISLGILLSGFFKRPANTGYSFFALFLPLFFLGSFPLEELPQKMQTFIPFLPTSMGISLINNAFENNQEPGMIMFQIAGLVIYTLVFLISGIILHSKKNS